MFLHLLVLRHAGGLWRDEANKAQFALMPSLSAVFSALRYDSSPMGSNLYFRFWTVFSSTDRGFRVAGLVVGIGIVGAFGGMLAPSGSALDDEFSTMNVNVNGTHHMLSALKEASPRCRFYFAATSEMFGRAEETPQTERTRFHPHSAYGISKVAGFDLTRNYREAYGIHASSGILFNHESPRRGYEFVTRKITSNLARIRAGEIKELVLGNLDARRDWGHARDYVDAMWSMLQQPEPDDYVIATGETHSVGEFAELAFATVGLDYRDFVKTSQQFFRPAEVDILRSDSSKARAAFGWVPEVSFSALVKEMVTADCARCTGAAPRS